MSAAPAPAVRAAVELATCARRPLRHPAAVGAGGLPRCGVFSCGWGRRRLQPCALSAGPLRAARLGSPERRGGRRRGEAGTGGEETSFLRDNRRGTGRNADVFMGCEEPRRLAWQPWWRVGLCVRAARAPPPARPAQLRVQLLAELLLA